MFDIFKKNITVVAPISGKVIALEMVPDEVFAKKIVGDGVAIDELEGDLACAPIDGKLVLVFRTNHAFAIQGKDGIEILVHIGIDTVELDGEGFERLAEEGTVVKTGDPIIRFNRDIIKNSGRSLASPVIITTPDQIGKLSINAGGKVVAGQEVIFSYKKK